MSSESNSVASILETTAYRAFNLGDYEKLLNGGGYVPPSVRMATATSSTRTTKRTFSELHKLLSSVATAATEPTERTSLMQKVRSGSAILPPSRYPMHLPEDLQLKHVKSISNIEILLDKYMEETGTKGWTDRDKCVALQTSEFNKARRNGDMKMFQRAGPGEGINSAATLVSALSYRHSLAAALASATLSEAPHINDFGIIKWSTIPVTRPDATEARACGYFSIDHGPAGLDQSSPHGRLLETQISRIRHRELSDIMVVDVCELEAPFQRPEMVFDYLTTCAKTEQEFTWLSCNGFEDDVGQNCASPDCYIFSKEMGRSIAGRKTGVDADPVLKLIEKAEKGVIPTIRSLSEDEERRLNTEIQYLVEDVRIEFYLAE